MGDGFGGMAANGDSWSCERLLGHASQQPAAAQKAGQASSRGSHQAFSKKDQDLGLVLEKAYAEGELRQSLFLRGYKWLKHV